MSSRDQVSPDAQADFHGLLGLVLPFGEKMLADDGEFFPYGATVSNDGEMRAIAGWTGDERPASVDLLETLYEGRTSSGVAH